MGERGVFGKKPRTRALGDTQPQYLQDAFARKGRHFPDMDYQMPQADPKVELGPVPETVEITDMDSPDFPPSVDELQAVEELYFYPAEKSYKQFLSQRVFLSLQDAYARLGVEEVKRLLSNSDTYVKSVLAIHDPCVVFAATETNLEVLYRIRDTAGMRDPFMPFADAEIAVGSRPLTTDASALPTVAFFLKNEDNFSIDTEKLDTAWKRVHVYAKRLLIARQEAAEKNNLQIEVNAINAVLKELDAIPYHVGKLSLSGYLDPKNGAGNCEARAKASAAIFDMAGYQVVFQSFTDHVRTLAYFQSQWQNLEGPQIEPVGKVYGTEIIFLSEEINTMLGGTGGYMEPTEWIDSVRRRENVEEKRKENPYFDLVYRSAVQTDDDNEMHAYHGTREESPHFATLLANMVVDKGIGLMRPDDEPPTAFKYTDATEVFAKTPLERSGSLIATVRTKATSLRARNILYGAAMATGIAVALPRIAETVSDVYQEIRDRFFATEQINEEVKDRADIDTIVFAQGPHMERKMVEGLIGVTWETYLQERATYGTVEFLLSLPEKEGVIMLPAFEQSRELRIQMPDEIRAVTPHFLRYLSKLAIDAPGEIPVQVILESKRVQVSEEALDAAFTEALKSTQGSVSPERGRVIQFRVEEPVRK